MVRLFLKKNVLYLCRKYGLPKTPICNAGKASILATLHPARTDYLYFVAKKRFIGAYFCKRFSRAFS